MKPLDERSIRRSFVNCSKGEAARMTVPRDLDRMPWDDLDFLGWRDPGAPDRSCLVVERDGALVGVALRFPSTRRTLTHRSMCSLCLTTHSGGVSLMVAAKAGKAGQQGNTVGAYMCSDLACPLYVRGKRDAGIGARLPETLTLEEKIQRTVSNLAAFVAKVTA
jgi:hypothetical protein